MVHFAPLGFGIGPYPLMLLVTQAKRGPSLTSSQLADPAQTIDDSLVSVALGIMTPVEVAYGKHNDAPSIR